MVTVVTVVTVVTITTLLRGLDSDVIVSEVRDTSHKPDEIYGMIERLSPGSRKLELFGRMHNTQCNWLTLGNQVQYTMQPLGALCSFYG